MYRLSRIFVSDITAGGNLLRNGYVPVFREDGQTDHGVLFAVNGTCKTTLLSFILSVFCPKSKRFVQYLQSDGDKTLEQYLIPGRPALVVLDLSTITPPTLFEAEPVDHLVLGQLLYRHRTMPDKTDRTFFIAQSADLFDELRASWDELLEQEKPYKAVRDYMLPRIQQTTSQKEWSDKLEQLGLDPWLIDRQVDFARTEGGIKDAFKFRSEEEFLSFFLGCVTDLDAATTLRQRIEQDLRKMQERPRKISQLNTVRNLKERIADFDATAVEWRSAHENIETWQLKLGEATHLLQEAEQAVAEKRSALIPVLEEAEAQHLEAGNAGETVQSNILSVEKFRQAQEIAEQQKKLRDTQKEIERVQGENVAISAADFIADIRATQAQATTKKEALSQAGEEITPIQRKMDSLAAQYHARLDDELSQIEKNIRELSAKRSDIEAQRKERIKKHEDALKKQKSLDNTISRLKARIQEAEAMRNALPMDEGEEPVHTLERLQAEHAGIDKRLTRVQGEIRTLEQNLQTENNRWRTSQEERSKGETQLALARERVKAEAEERLRLSSDSHIIRVAGSREINLTSADLISRFDDAMARSRTKVSEKTRAAMKLEQLLETLERTETLAADDQTMQLLAHYHQAGIAPEELKSYPDYLAEHYESAEQIATFIESDPGRFTGIMASSTHIMEKLQAVPVPPWLHRPVVISTPCEPEDISPISQTVIRPLSPEIYSKRHLTAVRDTHKEELAELNRIVADTENKLQEMEKASRALHAYRDKFPDRASVAALADSVTELETSQKQRTIAIQQAEEAMEKLKLRKNDLETQYRQVVDEAASMNQLLRQVEKWLKNYAGLAQWEEEVEQKQLDRLALEKSINNHIETLADLKEDDYRIAADISEQKILQKGLDERAGEVLRPQDVKLSKDERKAALSMDLNTLRRLHESAREDIRQMTHELGIDMLRKELDALEEKIAQRESRFEAFCRRSFYDNKKAEAWVGRSQSQREERQQELAKELETYKEANIRLESEIGHQQKELARVKAALTDRKFKGMKPDLTSEMLTEQDPDSLLHRLRAEKRKFADECERLATRCNALKEKQNILLTRHQDIRLVLAENKRFDAVWDENSPRHPWPDLLKEPDAETSPTSIEQLQQELEKMVITESRHRETVDAAQRRMKTAFDSFQIDLQSELFHSNLPAVVDELRTHDAESLGVQASELIQRCEDIARNLETDLEITQRFMDSLVEMLLQHSREYYQKLRGAAQEVLPEEVFIYGGKPILRAGTRLDFAKHQDVFRQSIENWLYELMQQGRLPEVNPRMGNCLGSELLYQLLGAASGRHTFGIRLLKCDDSGSKYEPVGKDLGSGGEALTIAVLLYALLISMRRRRRYSPYDARIPAFLVLDNPLGVCNRSDFLDAQLKVAGRLGLQCVYLTGINDRESLDLFELRVAIRKGDKQVEIDGNVYDCLEITEFNVEKQQQRAA
ncbi:coiled-coil domain-containing protein [Desulfogranum japonicum]|uniref:hypothetical protein n=1 Tax=Desulfogranum japonicum TaxID=231447 RepID=UPI0004011693|nr:hypothetical protein [Desulfogranum japonicum]